MVVNLQYFICAVLFNKAVSGGLLIHVLCNMSSVHKFSRLLPLHISQDQLDDAPALKGLLALPWTGHIGAAKILRRSWAPLEIYQQVLT
jgi:hypothetical protein